MTVIPRLLSRVMIGLMEVLMVVVHRVIGNVKLVYQLLVR